MHKVNLVIIFLLFNATWGQAQDVIKLRNPSFEDEPRRGQENGGGPLGWLDCSALGETAVDVQPGAFNVHKPANDGKTYLGMVVRANDTVESVCQMLRYPLLKNQTYVMTLELARSDLHISYARYTDKDEIFNTPAVLNIYGGNTYCEELELLAFSEPVENVEWERRFFIFRPKQDLKYLMLKLGYKELTFYPYNGNVLIDNMSHIYAVDEDTDPEAFFNN